MKLEGANLLRLLGRARISAALLRAQLLVAAALGVDVFGAPSEDFWGCDGKAGRRNAEHAL